MGNNYRTSNQGIAAYLMTKGYNVINSEKGQTKNGKDCIYIEFSLDHLNGREMGDEFFNGDLVGNIKDFHDALYKVRKIVYEARTN